MPVLSSKNKSCIKYIFILTLSILPYLNGFAQGDSSYVQRFEQQLNVKVYAVYDYTSLEQEYGEKKIEEEITFSTNKPLGLGLGISWKNISISGSYGFQFMRDRKKGKTESFDLQYHRYGRRVVLDFYILNQKGFYKKSEDKKDEITLCPNMSIRQYKVLGQYVFNGKKFSYQAAFNQNEKQLRSTGSFILGGGIHYSHIKADSSLLIIKELQPKSFQVGLNLGYAYTYVFKRDFYLTGSLAIGVNLGTQRFSTFFKDHLEVYPSILPRFAAGYNAKAWSIGLSYIDSSSFVLFSSKSSTRLSTGQVQLSFIKRFRDKKQITYNNILFSTRIYSSILEESH